MSEPEPLSVLVAYLTRAVAVGALLAALAVATVGCGPSRRPTGSTSGTVAVTASGTPVSFPAWLGRYPDLRAAAMLEVERAGVPQGWIVVVELPKFSVLYRGEWVLVRGDVDFASRAVRVGWREDGEKRLLPALNYEASNARLGRETDPAGVAAILGGSN